MAHPARYTGIGFVLRPQPDPDVTQARCSIRDCTATPASRLALTLTPLIWCCISFPTHPVALACGSEVRRCEPWTHSSLSRHPALPCLRFTAHRHRLNNKIQPRSEFKARYCRIIFYTRVEHGSSRPKCADETESVFRFIGHTLAIVPPIGEHRPAYSARLKSGFPSVSAGRLGEPERQTGAAAPYPANG